MSIVRQILEERKNYTQGTTVTNCIMHMHLNYLERPKGCELCMYDVMNTLSRALTVNAFLNSLLDKLEAYDKT